jgi:hypothetical protein
MDTKINKIVQFIMYGLLGLSVVMIIIFFMSGLETQTFANAKEYSFPSFTNGLMYWSYFLLGFAIIITVLFALFMTITDFASAKGALIGFIAVVLVLGISYGVASSEIPTFFNSEKFGITASVSKLIGGGLISTYVLGAIAIVGILITEISKSFK